VIIDRVKAQVIRIVYTGNAPADVEAAAQPYEMLARDALKALVTARDAGGGHRRSAEPGNQLGHADPRSPGHRRGSRPGAAPVRRRLPVLSGPVLMTAPIRFTFAVEGELVIDRVLAGLETRISNISPAWPAVVQEFRAIVGRAFASARAPAQAPRGRSSPPPRRPIAKRKGYGPAEHPILERTGTSSARSRRARAPSSAPRRRASATSSAARRAASSRSTSPHGPGRSCRAAPPCCSPPTTARR
jgi:hypothetical protein